MTKHLFLSDLRLLEHETGNHPENASRLKAILDTFSESIYQKHVKLSHNRFATQEEIVKVHNTSYVKHIISMTGKHGEIDAETILSPQSITAALLAAGIGLELVEQVIEGKIQNGFALVRPPGHHAMPPTGMGFCVFNNIAIAAKKALEKGIKRILILDWDVHHGNGTQEVFYEDDRVMFIDMHQDNLFPIHSGLKNETGKGAGKGYTVNIPLPASCVDEDYLYIFDMLIKPLAIKYRPELILVSAGFDAHESDPLGFMKLTTNGFGLLTARIKQVADKLCAGKLVFFLEGGYNPYFLAKNVLECVSILSAESEITEIKDITELTSTLNTKIIKEIVKEIYDSHFKY